SGICLSPRRAPASTAGGNLLTWTVPASTKTGIYLRATIQNADGIVMSNNRLAGTIANAIQLYASPFSFNNVTLVGIQARGAAHGLKCAADTGGTFSLPI